MGNQSYVTIATNKDINATQFVARFKNGSAATGSSGSGSGGGGGGAGISTAVIVSNGAGSSSGGTSARYATHVHINSGEQPSFGFVGVPIDRLWDEAAISLALKKSGFAGRVPLRTRAAIDFVDGNKTSCVLTGTLVQYVHVIHEDSICGLIFDDKWWLSKITVFGRMVYDPTTALHFYDAGEETIFNHLGFPNCIDSPMGPRFAPSHRFGYRQQFDLEDYSEPAPGSAQIRTRSWTVEDVIKYLRDIHYTGEGDSRAVMKVDYGEMTLPSFIKWPSAMATVLGSNRTVNSFKLQGMSLLRALSLTGRKAGAYDLICKPNNGFDSTLQFVDMGPNDTTGSIFYLPSFIGSADVGDLMNDPQAIMAGYLNESCINLFDDVCIVGDPPCVERFLSMTNSGLGLATNVEGDSAIEPAWSAADEVLFKAYITGYTIPNSQIAFNAACKIWPLVYCAYRVKQGFDIWLNTKWNGMFNTGNPRIRPMLLTGDQQNSANPRNWQPKPIVIEYEATQSDADPPVGSGDWTPATPQDALEVSADGQYFRIPAMRDKSTPQTWGQPGYQGNLYNGATMRKLNIRLTLAVEADWAITGRARGDPNRVGLRVIGPKTTFLAPAEPLDYVETLRKNSFPNGLQKIGATERTFTDRAIQGSELFTDRESYSTGRLPRHGVARLRDVHRIEYTGQLVLPKLNPALYPGMTVSIESSGGIPTFSVVKSVLHDAPMQVTIIELTSSDLATIYDTPTPPPAASANTIAGEAPTAKPKNVPTAKQETATPTQTETQTDKNQRSSPQESTTSANDDGRSTQAATAPAATASSGGKSVDDMSEAEQDQHYAKQKEEQKRNQPLKSDNPANAIRGATSQPASRSVVQGENESSGDYEKRLGENTARRQKVKEDAASDSAYVAKQEKKKSTSAKSLIMPDDE